MKSECHVSNKDKNPKVTTFLEAKRLNVNKNFIYIYSYEIRKSRMLNFSCGFIVFYCCVVRMLNADRGSTCTNLL